MTESIGTARLDIVVDTSGFDAAITSAKRSVSGMSQAAQAEYNKLNAVEKRRVDGLIKQADTLKLTREQQILYNAALKGVPTSILDELKGKLGGTAGAAKTAAKEFNAYGQSAKQTAAALRGVPAQLTDIFVGLSTGQRPLSILLQQGGQLKDMFGGVVPAARALGGAIAGFINPVTIAAAVVGALGYAWYQASERSVAFNKALILTGHNADITAKDLANMAGELDHTLDTTKGKATEVLAAVAGTGQFTASQIKLVAQAAIQMETATGRSIQQTIKEFASLKGDPVEAILALNDAIGDNTNVTHFLTQEQINQIEKLKEQGREADATAFAFKAYAESINGRAPQVTQNLSLIGAELHTIASISRDAWDSIVNGLGRADKAAFKGMQTLAQYAKFIPGGTAFAVFESINQPKQTGALPGVGKPKKGPIVNSKEELESIAFKDRYLTKEESKKKAIAELDRLRAHYTKEEYSILKAGIEERFKKPKDTSAKGIEGAESRAAIQALEDQLKKEQGLINNQTQLLEANYAARTITVQNYYAEQKRLSQEGTEAQERALEGEIAALASRNVKGKLSIDNTREMAQREAELAKVRADGATKLAVLNIQEANALKQRKLANEAYKTALDEQASALQAQMDSQIARISMGEREFEIQSHINELYRDQAKELLALARQRDAGEIDPDVYEQRVSQLRSAIDAEVEIVRHGYSQMAAAQKDWANGAIKAFKDYQDQANDVAGQTYNIFTDAFHGLEDVLTDFFTKGKADWKGFFNDIAAEITRFIIKQQLSKWLTSVQQGMSASQTSLAGGSSSAGSFGGFFNALFGGGSASGNAFVNGSPVQAFATGGVVDRTTAFGMSGGRFGVMGEAGPEAILPLHRGPDGKLGVRAAANDDSGPRVANYHTTFLLPQTTTPQTQAQIAQNQQRAATRATARNR